MMQLYVFGAIVLINCAYYILFSRFSFLKVPKPSSKQQLPVSLIICAKNEAENLKEYLPLWQNQNYANYEIILINDASIDDTLDIMEAFAKEDPRIKVVDVKNNEAFWASKKYALTLGIKRAKSNYLIFSDADCFPASEEWLTAMASKFDAEKNIVLGYGGYNKMPGFLNKLIRFETAMTAIQYFSYAQAKMPYMGVGRNLAYTSKVYYDNSGFINHIKIASGDDDLFVNEAANSKNTAICIDPNAFTYSKPKESRKEWILQKKRHYSTAKLYKNKHRFLLGLYYVTNFLFWLGIPIVLWSNYWLYALILIIIRLIVQYVIIGKAARKLDEKDLILFIPFYEIFLILSQMSIFISNTGEKKTRWK